MACARPQCGGGWKALVGCSQTVQTVLLDLKQKGHTEQDKQVVYADVSKRLGQAASILPDSLPPAVALALTEAFLASSVVRRRRTTP